MIEDSLLANCSNLGQGGSIYFAIQGQCVQNRVCAYKSASLKSGAYCKIQVSILAQNNIHWSSLAFIGENDDNLNGSVAVQLDNGILNYTNVNSSYTNTGGGCIHFCSITNDNSSINFCNFANNSQNLNTNAAHYVSYTDTFSFVIRCCNYLNNQMINVKNYALIRSQKLVVTVSSCYFDNNIGIDYAFDPRPPGKHIINNCRLGNLKETIRTGEIDIQLINSSYERNIQEYYQSYVCEAEYPMRVNYIPFTIFIGFYFNFNYFMLAAATHVFIFLE